MKKHRLSYLILVLASMFAVNSNSAFSEDGISVVRAELCLRHPSLSRESLLTLTGSEDNLVSALIKLRRETKPPMLGVRAEKLLITFSERTDVQDALLMDVSDPQFFGLGSVVLSLLPSITNVELRKRLASEAISNTKSTSAEQSRYRAIIESLPANILQ